jgi:hypothetical protein
LLPNKATRVCMRAREAIWRRDGISDSPNLKSYPAAA